MTDDEERPARLPHVEVRVTLVDPDRDLQAQSTKIHHIGDFRDMFYTRELEYLFQDILGEFRNATDPDTTQIHRQ